MRKLFEGVKAELIFLGIASVALGIFMILKPEIVTKGICYVVGAVLVICGIFNLIAILVQQGAKPFTFRIIPAALSIVVGAFFLLGADFVFNILWFAIGVAIIMNSTFKFQYAYELKYLGYAKWWMNLVFAVVSLGFGIVLLLVPSEVQTTMIVISGIIILIDGVSDLGASFTYIMNNHQIRKEEKAEIKRRKAEANAAKKKQSKKNKVFKEEDGTKVYAFDDNVESEENIPIVNGEIVDEGVKFEVSETNKDEKTQA